MTDGSSELVNWAAFAQARAQLGPEFVRILGYFREDGVKSLDAIENAMRALDATALVRPAHTLKGESLQFGAETLGLLAEHIEHSARHCVETHQQPDALLADVTRLRPMFQATMDLFERETTSATPAIPVAYAIPVAPAMPAAAAAPAAPVAPRRAVVFGRKAV